MGLRPLRRQCFISTHSTTAEIDQPCDGSTITYFTDLTDNHNKAMVTVSLFARGMPQTTCALTVIIESDGRPLFKKLFLRE
ncbi:hypothetical protein EIZ39_12330 [Ammoniphilus sp. CFH 90114]|nr:hypothetical protein EIZ39_12330 [Ammoniphilus sp. CFH 90114]